MATLYFKGDATAVAQVDTIQITAFDAATTYSVDIGGVVVSVIGNTSVNQTATDLHAALTGASAEANTIYFDEGVTITWTVATDTVTATAFVPGVPFEITASVTGGTGTLSHTAEATASAGPHDWGTGDNWLNTGTGAFGTAPVSGDDVVIENTSVNIVYGLDQNAVALDSLTIDQSYTGKIGLERLVFATSVDGDTTDGTKVEYREHYLKIGAEFLDIGRILGPGTQTGSSLLKINNVDAAASTQTIHNTATTGAGVQPAVRLLNTHASSNLLIRSAPGGVGIAIDEPGETTTYASIKVSDESQASRVFTGSGLTLTTWEQNGGNNSLRVVDDGTLTTLNMRGGVLSTNGDFTITTLNMVDGTLTANHERIGGVAVTTANLDGGLVDLRNSSTARTWTTVNLGVDGSMSADTNLTITTLNEPAEPYIISVTS
jgi:hypothetical protein